MSTAADPIIAKPPGECCLKGFVHAGTPKGEMITVAGVGTYITKPPDAQSNSNWDRIVLYFPDVWGLHGSFQENGKLLMDYFASEGFLVLGIDYFRGDPIQNHFISRDDPTRVPGFDFDSWKDKHMNWALENVPIWMEAVAKQFGNEKTKYATVGYCFGAPFVMNSLQEGTMVSAGAYAHPAFLYESHFRKCAKPIFLSCAETDHTFSVEFRHRAEEILAEDKRVYNFQLFSGVVHGFALRGNMDNPYERWVKETSASSIVSWFKHFL